jgi:hypothetical protein
MSKMSEKQLSKYIQLEASKHGLVLFRNNRGLFLTLDGSRKTRAGLDVNGSSDFIGWTKEGIFAAVEVKVGYNKPSDTQKLFIENAKNAGSFACCVWSVEDLKKELDLFYRTL